MKWRVRLITKRKRKQPLRVKANSIDELVQKLSKQAGRFLDFELETMVNDPKYWKSVILLRLFQTTRGEDESPTLF